MIIDFEFNVSELVTMQQSRIGKLERNREKLLKSHEEMLTALRARNEKIKNLGGLLNFVGKYTRQLTRELDQLKPVRLNVVVSVEGCQTTEELAI
jgi:hypothetical protein